MLLLITHKTFRLPACKFLRAVFYKIPKRCTLPLFS